MNELTKELRDLQYATFPEIFGKFRELSEKYGNIYKCGSQCYFSRELMVSLTLSCFSAKKNFPLFAYNSFHAWMCLCIFLQV